MFLKREPYRNKKWLAGAEGQCCVNCGAQDDTVVAAHYQGFRALSVGKGKSQKPDDYMVADLCARCHLKFDSYETSDLETKTLRQIDHSEQFLFLVAMTIRRRLEQGFRL